MGEKYLPDEEYQRLNSLTKPILYHIISKYENRPTDSMDIMEKWMRKYSGEFLFLGSESIPLAIEISQWGYNTHIALSDDSFLESINLTLDRHASQVRDLLVYDYFEDIPECTVAVSTNVLNILNDSDSKRWMGRVLKRADEALVTVRNTKDWCSFFKKYKVNILQQDNVQTCLRLTSR